MSQIPHISESEWEIMKLLWEESPQSAQDIIVKLDGKADWKPKTVKSLISRLLKKKAIGYNTVNRSYEYYPLYNKDECVQKESRKFIDRVYNGQLDTLFASFLSDEQLDEEKLKEYKSILDNAISQKSKNRK